MMTFLTSFPLAELTGWDDSSDDHARKIIRCLHSNCIYIQPRWPSNWMTIATTFCCPCFNHIIIIVHYAKLGLHHRQLFHRGSIVILLLLVIISIRRLIMITAYRSAPFIMIAPIIIITSDHLSLCQNAFFIIILFIPWCPLFSLRDFKFKLVLSDWIQVRKWKFLFLLSCQTWPS